jgi:TPP-dependent 2-oxoacid decarboxylase
LLENNGYTVERMIHGENALYNEVARWDYSKVAELYGPNFTHKYHGPIKTNQDLEKLLSSGDLRSEGFHLVELTLEQMDLPWSVKMTRESIAK